MNDRGQKPAVIGFDTSNYRTSAAVVTLDGEILADYRELLPVSEGERDFAAIAVVGGKGGEITGIFPPCGICRQVMQEFCCREFLIHMGGKDGEIQTVTLEELLPFGFHL